MATTAARSAVPPPATPRQATATTTTTNTSNLPDPPFEEAKEGIKIGDLVIPTAYRISGPPREFGVINKSGKKVWLKFDLNVVRLNRIHKHLWMAGLPQIPRALHDHLRIGRAIALTEQADLHLVWAKNTIFIKPLPDYLLNHSFWKDQICPDPDLIQDAKGFLLSYLWLITSKADWKLATEKGLLNDNVEWKQWVEFSESALSSTLKMDHSTLHDINPRYLYGELRLDRLSLIYRFCSATRKLSTFVRGYNYGYYNYSSFIERNFAWVLTAIVYITIVLTAMQVGLVTDRLADDVGFQRAAFGFTVFSIIAPLAIVVSGAAILLILFCVNWRFAKTQRKQANTKYPHLKMHPKAKHARVRVEVDEGNVSRANSKANANLVNQQAIKVSVV